jgi:hypothetical protein
MLLQGNQNTTEAMVRLTSQMFSDAFPDFQQFGKDMLTSTLDAIAKDPNLDLTAYIQKYWIDNATKAGIDNPDFQAFMETMVTPFQNAISGQDIAGYEQYYKSNGKALPDWLINARNLNDVFGLISSSFNRDIWKEVLTTPNAGWLGVALGDLFAGNYNNIPMSSDVMVSLFQQAGVTGGQSYNAAVNSAIIGGNVPPTLVQNSGYGGLVTQMGTLGTNAGNAFNSNLQSQISSYSPSGQNTPPTDANGDPEIYYNNQPGFAEGGRATTESIFGEAGPEWAIPEAHTTRTAQLLDSARAASGFSWGEILARAGGLNGDPDAGAYIGKIVYAPVIYAKDATGVEEKLIEDKRRFRDKMDEYLFEKSRREF